MKKFIGLFMLTIFIFLSVSCASHVKISSSPTGVEIGEIDEVKTRGGKK